MDDKAIHEAGKKLATKLKGFYGKVVYNIKNGTYVNANIEQSIIPEPENQEGNRNVTK